MLKKILIHIVCIAVITIVFALVLSPSIAQICSLFDINMTGAKSIKLSCLTSGAIVVIWAQIKCLDVIFNLFNKDE